MTDRRECFRRGAKLPRPTRRRFTAEQRWWLEKMAEHVASKLGLDAGDFELPPPEVIVREIVEDLESALEQFKLIAGDLNGGGVSSDNA